MELFPIIFEDPCLLVIHKPSGLVCHPTKGDATSSLVGRLRLYLEEGSPCHLINRLDRETSGIILIGKDNEIARDLRRQWEARTVRKTYLAIVHGWPTPPMGIVDGALGKDEESPVVIKDTVRPDGTPAETAYRCLKQWTHQGEPFALLRVEPKTGRKHQIRIHLQSLGHPIVGDKLYGLDERCYLDFIEDRLTVEQRAQLRLPWQALHARGLRVVYQGTTRVFRTLPEPWFLDFLRPSIGSSG